LADRLDDNLSLAGWLAFMTDVTRDLKKCLASNGILVFVIGDVAKAKRGQLSLARALIQHLHHERLFSYVGCFSDYIGQEVKTTRIWNDTRGAATEMDRLIVLSDDVPQMRLEGLAEALAMPDLKSRFAQLLTPEHLALTARRFSAAA
jgi:hypothetical protein